MKLSIIVPVYNMMAGNKLKFCLDSLVNQTIEDYEIIAVNDASTDDSLSLLYQYADKYGDRFRVINLPENRKQGGAKNAGLDAACGEYVGFVDSDDWIKADMYEKMLKKVGETGADVVGCDYCITHEQNFTIGKIVHNSREEQVGDVSDEKFRSFILDPGSLVVKIYKRQLFEQPKLRFPEKIFFEDNAITVELFSRVKHFEYIKEPLYYYYQHNASTVHVITEERCTNRLESMRIMLAGAKERGVLEKFHDEIEFRFTNLFYQNTLFTYMQGVKKINLGYVRRLGREMRKCFPGFMKNPYYEKRVNAEEKKFIALQQRSTVVFVMYYKFVYLVRRLRARSR